MFKTTGLRWIWLAVLVLVLDQVTKIAIWQNFELYERLNILPFFNLVYAQNTGAAFSFLADAGGWQKIFFSAIAVFASGLLSYWLYKTPADRKILPIGYSLILGGAIGNLIDRLAYGYVVDFLDFFWGNAHFAAFNVADSGIVVGAGFVILDAFINKDQADNKTELKNNV